MTISTGGSYRLTSGLSVVNAGAIEIDAPNVTLDLNGFTLNCFTVTFPTGGPCTQGVGVNTARDHVTIRNGTVRGYGGKGISAVGDGVAIEAMRVIASGQIGIECGEGCSIRNTAATLNGALGNGGLGGGMKAGAGAIVSGSQAVDNSNGNGIQAGIGSLVVNVLARGNPDGNGILASLRSAVIGSTASENGQDGILAGAACTIRENTASTNGSDGIRVAGGCNVTANVAENNAAFGLNSLSNRDGYANNVFTQNNADATPGPDDPQVTGGVDLGGNLCGTTAGCP